ncbi:MAG TPA: hypothetical protein VHM91_09820, partial [Verrucomicrobiales bacterium]|nr:hypothetical protein [Verrucomicrobiales bacterium]
LILAAPSYEVMDALRSNGLDRIFETAPSREAALDAIGGGGGSTPAIPPLPVIPTDPEPFHSTPPIPVRTATEDPARRREAEEGEQNSWVMPDKGAVRQGPPPVTTAPVTPQLPPKQKKKSAAPLVIILLLLLGGGGAAAWFFLFNKKPEVLAQSGEWTRVAGTDTEFEIKFRNAAMVIAKNADELPDGLYLDPSVKDFGDGTKAQLIKGDTTKTGEHAFSVVAKAEGGAESPPVKFTVKITAEDVRDTSGGKLRELMVGVPLVAGVQELARGCVKATAKGLEESGLSVKVDTNRKVAVLEGTPKKDGEIKFTVDAENEEQKSKPFSYKVVVKPEPKKVEVTVTDPKTTGTDPKTTGTDPKTTGTDPKTTGTDPKTTGTDPKTTGTDPKTTGTDPKTTGTDPKTTNPPKVEPQKPRTLEPAMLEMLSDRIDKSRFEESDKAQMRLAVNQVEAARKIATVKFGNGEKSVSPEERDKLREALRNAPEVKGSERESMDFIVIGYASRSGTLASNIAISMARASSVEAVLKAPEFKIHPKFTGDYGATDVLGRGDEASNRVVEVYAVLVKEETRKTFQRLVEYMRSRSGSAN